MEINGDEFRFVGAGECGLENSFTIVVIVGIAIVVDERAAFLFLGCPHDVTARLFLGGFAGGIHGCSSWYPVLLQCEAACVYDSCRNEQTNERTNVCVSGCLLGSRSKRNE